MKTIVATALAAATLFATPVLAAQRAHHVRHASQDAMQVRGGYDAAVMRGDVVMSSNHVVGQDPDPAIRTQLLHEGEVSAN